LISVTVDTCKLGVEIKELIELPIKLSSATLVEEGLSAESRLATEPGLLAGVPGGNETLYPQVTCPPEVLLLEQFTITELAGTLIVCAMAVCRARSAVGLATKAVLFTATIVREPTTFAGTGVRVVVDVEVVVEVEVNVVVVFVVVLVFDVVEIIVFVLVVAVEDVCVVEIVVVVQVRTVGQRSQWFAPQPPVVSMRVTVISAVLPVTMNVSKAVEGVQGSGTGQLFAHSHGLTAGVSQNTGSSNVPAATEKCIGALAV